MATSQHDRYLLRTRFEIRSNRIRTSTTGHQDATSQLDTDAHHNLSPSIDASPSNMGSSPTLNTRRSRFLLYAASFAKCDTAGSGRAPPQGSCEHNSQRCHGAYNRDTERPYCGWQNRVDSGLDMQEPDNCRSVSCSSAASGVSSSRVQENSAEAHQPHIRPGLQPRGISEIAHPRPTRSTRQSLEDLHMKIQDSDGMRSKPYKTDVGSLPPTDTLLKDIPSIRSSSAPPHYEPQRPLQVFPVVSLGLHNLAPGSYDAPQAYFGNAGVGGQYSGQTGGLGQSGAANSRRPDQQSSDVYGVQGDPELAGVDPIQQTPADQESRGYQCIFSGGNGCISPTSNCRRRKPRKYTSHLKRHHLHRKHPNGPFACCDKCFERGIMSGSQEFVNFQNQDEVTAHQNDCTRYLCIHEPCINFLRTQNHSSKCNHEPRKPRDIWRMWYRRGYDLDPQAHVPEPDDPRPPPGYQLPQSRSQAPVPAPQPHAGPSRPVLNPDGLSLQASSIVPTATPFNIQTPASSSLPTSETPLEGFARGLLNKLIEPEPFWTVTLGPVYESVWALSGHQLDTIHESDPEAVVRIKTLRSIIKTCRNLLMNSSMRNQGAWSDLRVLASTAMLETLPSQPAQPWPTPLSGVGGQFQEPANSNLHIYENTVMGYSAVNEPPPADGHYSDPFQLQAPIPSPANLNSDINLDRRVQASNLSYDENQSHYATPSQHVGYANVDLATAAAQDARSSHSRTTDTGYYSGAASNHGKARAMDHLQSSPSFENSGGWQ